MITREVGKYADVKFQTPHSFLNEGMRRNFDSDGLDTRVEHLGQHLLQIERLRRGVMRRDGRVTVTIADRPNHTGLQLGRLEHGFDEIGERGLTVGAGHSHQRQFCAGSAKIVRRPQTHRETDIFDAHGCGGSWPDSFPRKHDGNRAAAHGIGDEVMAIEFFSRHGKKYCSRANVSRVVC